MNIERIKELCSDDCRILNIAVLNFNHKNIIPRTVRSRGQACMQRLFYIHGGSAKFELNDKTIIATAGDILYFPPDITYVCTWEEGNPSNAAILLQFDLYANEERILLGEDIFIIQNDVDGACPKLFLLLLKNYEDGKLGYKIKCQSIALELLYSLITNAMVERKPQKSASVYTGLMYIENHYMDKINVNDLAKLCALSPTTFRMKFHEKTGMSPIEYKNMLIMKKAAELLSTGLYHVSEVAAKVGISDICYFNRSFKKIYKISPGKYKSDCLEKRQ